MPRQCAVATLARAILLAQALASFVAIRVICNIFFQFGTSGFVVSAEVAVAASHCSVTVV